MKTWDRRGGGFGHGGYRSPCISARLAAPQAQRARHRRSTEPFAIACAAARANRVPEAPRAFPSARPAQAACPAQAAAPCESSPPTVAPTPGIQRRPHNRAPPAPERCRARYPEKGGCRPPTLEAVAVSSLRAAACPFAAQAASPCSCPYPLVEAAQPRRVTGSAARAGGATTVDDALRDSWLPTRHDQHHLCLTQLSERCPGHSSRSSPCLLPSLLFTSGHSLPR